MNPDDTLVSALFEAMQEGFTVRFLPEEWSQAMRIEVIRNGRVNWYLVPYEIGRQAKNADVILAEQLRGLILMHKSRG